MKHITERLAERNIEIPTDQIVDISVKYRSAAIVLLKCDEHIGQETNPMVI